MTVSVIIPSYNRAQTLARALDSVLAQTLPPDEIILVDDGSTDDTARLLQQYPQVQRLYQENQGVSAARNAGIRAATGDWIALLDSDDAWLPAKLAQQLQALQHTDQPYRLCHSEEIWIRNGVRVNAMRKHAKSGGWIFTRCLPLCVISPSAALLHRSLFDDYGFFDTHLPACEDYDLWLRICAHEPVLFVDQALVVKYGGHADQLSRHDWGLDRFRVQALQKLLAHGQLDAQQTAAVRRTLIEKTDILLKGALKHANAELAADCRQLLATLSTTTALSA